MVRPYDRSIWLLTVEPLAKRVSGKAFGFRAQGIFCQSCEFGSGGSERSRSLAGFSLTGLMRPRVEEAAGIGKGSKRGSTPEARHLKDPGNKFKKNGRLHQYPAIQMDNHSRGPFRLPLIRRLKIGPTPDFNSPASTADQRSDPIENRDNRCLTRTSSSAETCPNAPNQIRCAALTALVSKGHVRGRQHSCTGPDRRQGQDPKYDGRAGGGKVPKKGRCVGI